jgi:predicted nucleic acid-binding protein
VSDDGVLPRPGQRTLVFDTMALSAFAESDRLDVLGSMLAGDRCYTTEIVRDEVRRGSVTRPELTAVERAEWLEDGALASDEELSTYLRWTERIGSTERDFGEASVFALAELRSAIAITDDRDATRVARTFGLDVHGTLWLIAGFCAAGKLTEHAAGGLIDALQAVGLRLPCTGRRFPTWARDNGLLPTENRSKP